MHGPVLCVLKDSEVNTAWHGQAKSSQSERGNHWPGKASAPEGGVPGTARHGAEKGGVCPGGKTASME